MQCGDHVLREENARRKQNRILQVREQSREIAAKLRQRIQEEKARQKDHVERVKVDELRKWRDNQADAIQENYDRIISGPLNANDEARREVEAQNRYAQRKQELDMIAAQRGRTALRKELADNQRSQKAPVRNKPRCRSTEVQTDRTELADQDRGVGIARIPDQGTLPPESVKCDDPISARSVDILEQSKKFVEDASKRLDEISAKVARCQQMERQVESQPPRPVVSRKQDVQPKPVKTNAASKLRTDVNRKPAPNPQKAVARLKKVIPSAKESVATSGGPSRGSVVCYDHPNRFTKTYDIPKSIIVKNALENDTAEDDAVTNAQNETLSNIEEANCKLARSKELKQKEAIRQLEAMEKSQVRRDYEMLAKTLDEVRKNRSTSPSAQQFVTGSVSFPPPSGSQKTVPDSVSKEFLHVPVRISCPKVEGQLNVGENVDNFSGSDSAKSIILEQVANLQERRPAQHEVVIHNNVPNIKVQSVRGLGDNLDGNPVKIIIQVEAIPPARGAMAIPADQPNLPMKPFLLAGPANESLSTNYMSPPSEIVTQVGKLLNNKKKPIKQSTKRIVPTKGKPSGLKKYIDQLLQMPQTEVDRISQNDVSDIPTPTDSVLNIPSNKPETIYDEQKLNSVSRIIEDNYSILEEVDELIAQNERTGAKPPSSISTSAPETESLLQRYASMSQTYNDRIHSLNRMINVIRQEKQTLLQDNGVPNVSVSERDTSTKYKDFGSYARTMTPSGSEMSTDFEEKPVRTAVEAEVDKPGRLGANKGIGLSRDSGISVSRPVTSTPEEKQFEPILKDIPKQNPLHAPAAIIEPEKKRPPNSITRYSPEGIQATGHELSTILEVDTPATVNVGTAESVSGEVRKFPTLEEFLSQNKNNVSAISEVEGEIVPIKSFVSFNKFVDNNGSASTMREMELNLSEIAEELRRRSLIAADAPGGSQDDDEKEYIRNLSRELEEMITRIKSQGLNEPNLSQISFRSIASGRGSANESTGQLLEKIQPSKFPTREEFNKMNNSQHYNSALLLKSFINDSKNDTAVSSGKETSERKTRISPRKSRDCSEVGAGNSAPVPSRRLSPDSSHSQPLNMSGDLMNALENNLSEMGLKWAVNMLKRSNIQLSSTSRSSSSENEVSKENIPFESKTMSLLSDLEKSSISDETKTSNIKNILLRELIKRNESCNSSSNGSVSSVGKLASDDGRCLRTSTPVTSNMFNSISTSTVLDKGEKTLAAADTSECLFSGESKLSSVREEIDTLSNYKLNIPKVRLDVGKYGRPEDSTLSTEYSLNEHNKRKMTRRIDKK